MTANVMKGFREECLAAGMDGYVAKPIRREALVAAMAQVVPDLLPGDSPVPTQPIAAPLREPRGGEPFDADALLEGTGGNQHLTLEMVKLCCEADGPRLCGELAAAVEKGDFRGVEQTAHALRGLVGAFHATACYEAALALEHSARQQHRDAIQTQAAQLDREFQRLAAALRRFAGAATRGAGLFSGR